MKSEDIEYYRKRAVRQRELALAAESPGIAKIHLELALKYDELVELAEPRPTLGVNWGDAAQA
ncbi:MAG: hypothetical protein M3Q19_05955 [Pseudomonadota bacterium]|nr:hypothetical protein [Pseudomonadota bacterium]